MSTSAFTLSIQCLHTIVVALIIILVGGVKHVDGSRNKQISDLREACQPVIDIRKTKQNFKNENQKCIEPEHSDSRHSRSINLRRKLSLYGLAVEIWYFVSVRDYPVFGLWEFILSNSVSRGGIVQHIRLYHFFDSYNETLGNMLKSKLSPSDSEFVSFHNTTLKDLFYGKVYFDAIRENHLFIKIDDDVVYSSKNSITSLVEAYLYHKRHRKSVIAVSANVINSFGFGPIHQHINAISFNHSSMSFTNHDSSKLYSTMNEEFTLTHETAIRRLQNGTLNNFNFGDWIQTEDCKSKQRIGINFILFPSLTVSEYNEMIEIKSFNKDEVYLTKVRGNLYSSPTVIVGSAVVVHLSTATQRSFLLDKIYFGEMPNRQTLSHSNEHLLTPLRNLAIAYGAAMRADCCVLMKCPLFVKVSVLLSSQPIKPYWEINSVITKEKNNQIKIIDKANLSNPTKSVILKTNFFHDERIAGRRWRTAVLLIAMLMTIMLVIQLHKRPSSGTTSYQHDTYCTNTASLPDYSKDLHFRTPARGVQTGV